MKKYSLITDVAFLNSNIKSKKEIFDLYTSGFFSDENKWKEIKLSNDIKGLKDNINSRLKNRMSQLSLGVYNVIEDGPGKDLSEDEEIYLFSGFGEIETTNIIIKNITIDNYSHVSPTLFHNSVHHTSLGYYTIISKVHNPCLTISDGLNTNLSFINYIKNRDQLNKSFVVVSGEEYSTFFDLDRTRSLKIIPTFISYRITPFSEKGFYYCGILDNIDDLKKLDLYQRSSTIFADKNSYSILKDEKGKKVMSEYPIVLDNPCGIIFRLSLPFSLGIKGRSLVIENINDKIHLFEVNI